MANVHADPDKLRQFASALSQSAQQLESIARQLQRGLDSTAGRTPSDSGSSRISSRPSAL